MMIQAPLGFCLIVLLGIFFSNSTLYAQYDIESWKGIELEKAWGNDLTFSIEEQVRLNNNLSQFKSAFIAVGLKYSPTKYMRVSGGYRYTLRETKISQRLYTDLALKIKEQISIFDPIFRLRYQEDYKVGSSADRYVRPKLSLKTKIKPLKTDASIAGELFYHLSNEGSEFDRYRLSLGLSRMIAKRTSATLAYVFQQEFNITAPLTSSVISLSFTIELDKYNLIDRRRLPSVKR